MKTFVASFVLVALIAVGAEARTWVDATGTETVEAELKLVKGNSIILKLANGQLKEVPFARLSQADREFVASGELLWQVVGVMGPLHAEESVWEKICEILLDFAHWVSIEGVSSIDNYDAVGRTLARDVARQNRRGSRRWGRRE